MINDNTRTAFMLVVTNFLSVLILFGVNLSGEQVAGLSSLINSTLIVFMLLVKTGQSKGSPSPVIEGGDKK